MRLGSTPILSAKASCTGKCPGFQIHPSPAIPSGIWSSAPYGVSRTRKYRPVRSVSNSFVILSLVALNGGNA